MLAAALLYVREFYRLRLTSYAACRRHYDVMPLPELHGEPHGNGRGDEAAAAHDDPAALLRALL